MKRDKTPRYLRMGCGEGLVARISLSAPRTPGLRGEAVVKPGRRKTGEGRR